MDAANLRTFMSKAGPVMEKVIEENNDLYLLQNKAAAKKRNAVELKADFRLPDELLRLFTARDKSGAKQPSQITKITSLHMFESAP